MPSAELTSTQAPHETAVDLPAPWSRSMHIVTGGHPAGFEAPARPEAVSPAATAEPWANLGRGQAAVHATGRWLRRALADCARTWALAAGVPPHLYP